MVAGDGDEGAACCGARRGSDGAEGSIDDRFVIVDKGGEAAFGEVHSVETHLDNRRRRKHHVGPAHGRLPRGGTAVGIVARDAPVIASSCVRADGKVPSTQGERGRHDAADGAAVMEAARHTRWSDAALHIAKVIEAFAEDEDGEVAL